MLKKQGGLKAIGKPEDWDMKVESLVVLIDQVANSYTKQAISDRYVKNLYQAKKIPNERGLSFKVLNKSINVFVE